MHLQNHHGGSELARVLARQMREVATNEAEDAVDQFCLHLDWSSPGGCGGWVAGDCASGMASPAGSRP